MKKLIATLISCLALCATVTSHAANFQQAADKAEQDLQKALSDLASLQNKIADEKIPLAKAVNQLEDEVIQKRTELAEKKSLATKAEAELIILRQQVKSYRDQNEYIAGLLTDFNNNFGSRLDVSERPKYDELISAATLATDSPDLSAVQILQQQIGIIQNSITRLKEVSGGTTYAGKAQGEDGTIRDGTFAKLGPLVFFSSNDGSSGGITSEEINNDNPIVYTPTPETPGSLAATLSSKSGPLPIDVTLGDAKRFAVAQKSIGDRVQQGGYVGYVIIALGIVSLIIALYKVLEVGTFKTPSNKLVGEILDDIEAQNVEAAMQKAKSVGGIGSELLETGIQNLHLSRAIIEELLFEKILKCRPTLERFLNFVAITAAAAPLLGLLGTVTGMIKTFDLIAIVGTGDPKSLSSGISEALITTALGLIVAIPTLILHGGLARLARRKVGQMEQTALAFINGLSKSKEGPANPDEVSF